MSKYKVDHKGLRRALEEFSKKVEKKEKKSNAEFFEKAFREIANGVVNVQLSGDSHVDIKTKNQNQLRGLIVAFRIVRENIDPFRPYLHNTKTGKAPNMHNKFNVEIHTGACAESSKKELQDFWYIKGQDKGKISHIDNGRFGLVFDNLLIHHLIQALITETVEQTLPAKEAPEFKPLPKPKGPVQKATNRSKGQRELLKLVAEGLINADEVKEFF